MIRMKSAFPASFDAYLRFALITQFSYFGGRRQDLTLMLLVKLKDAKDAEELIRRLRSHGLVFNVGPHVFNDGRARISSPFLTLRGQVDLVENEDAWDVWKDLTAYVELSMPIVPNLELDMEFIDKERPKSGATTVVAIIDDGCAFAHERFRVAAGDTKSRVFAIWDQNKAARPTKVGAKCFGSVLKDFRYGVEYRRSSSDPKEIGIDDWINLFKTPTGGVYEDACYRSAGFESLQYQISHGVHVTDVLAGSVPPGSRMSFDPTKPPTFELSTDDAALGTTDIIFVQIPREAIDDGSGRWLSAQVTEAMYFILSCIDPVTTQRLVVNLSYGPTTEPHDGQGNLETSLSVFTSHYDGKVNKPDLRIALPAGNSRLTDGHFHFKSTAAGEKKTWTWRAPPDNPVPIFAELWVPWADAGSIVTQLKPPSPIMAGDQVPTITMTEASPSSCGWVFTLPATRPSRGVAPPGPHGDWTIEVEFSKPGVELHAYVARSEQNINSRVDSKPSRFIDTDWEAVHGGFSRQVLKDGVCGTTGPCLLRTGTLSGIATASDDHILVAGGYRESDGVSSRYSSLGPSRAERQGPDYALPTDEAIALAGIRAAGSVSGATFRLVGTSTAAPQIARHILDAVPPVACRPAGQQAQDIGCDELPAP